MDFFFCFWFYCYCFLNNFIICWGTILLLIIITSYLLCLFCRVSLSSSSLNQNIGIYFLVILISSRFSFLKEMCVIRSLLFLWTSPSDYLFFFYPLEVALHVSSFLMILFLLMETTFEIELLGLWQNGIFLFFVLFWLFL